MPIPDTQSPINSAASVTEIYAAGFHMPADYRVIVYTVTAMIVVPLLLYGGKRCFSLVRRGLTALNAWRKRPATWAIQMGALQLQMQEAQNERFMQLHKGVEEMFAKQLQNTNMAQQEILAAVKAGAQKVTLDDMQMKQLRDLLGQESSETRKAVILHTTLLEDVAKQQKVLETCQDGALAQGREILQDQQNASKHLEGKINDLSDKLIKLDKLVDVAANNMAKLSNELHVGLVRAEQKAEKNHAQWFTEQGSLKALVNTTAPMIREVRNIVVDKLAQGLVDLQNEANGIRGRIDDLPVDRTLRMLADIQHVAGESKDALDQLWSWMTDVNRQVLEINSLVQDMENKVLDRLPKIPARKPPNQHGATTQGTNTDPPQQPAHGPEVIRLTETVPASSTGPPLFVAAQAPMPQIYVPGADPQYMLTPQQAAVIRSAFR